MNDSNNIFYYLRFENDYAFILNTVINVDRVPHWVVFYKRANVFILYIYIYIYDALSCKYIYFYF